MDDEFSSESSLSSENVYIPLKIPKTGINTFNSGILENLKSKYNLNMHVGSTSSMKGITDSSKTKKESNKITTQPENIKYQKVQKTTKIPSKYIECNNVFLVIDHDLLIQFGTEITANLEAIQINYKVEPQIVPNLITWIRMGDLSLNSKNINESIVLMRWNEVVNSLVTKSLISTINSIKEILPNKSMFLGIYGMENYFKFWKSRKQSSSKSLDKKFSDYINYPKITKQELEFALIELQLQCSCCYRFVESIEDVISLLSQFTKSITQLPEKLKSKEKLKHSEWYVFKDNKDCVYVDKNGNGLQRLWQQQLTTFEMARLEAAESILSKYPTPLTLFNEYEKYPSILERSKLLEDIPIRRAAGPLTTSRKIGPELSNKICTVFNAVDGNLVI